MLIRNSSRVIKTIYLDLKYDDGTKREGEVRIGTKLYLSFRRNCRLNIAYGVVTDIITHTHYNLHNHETHEDCIVFDMSRPYESNVCTIPLSDIIDFVYAKPKAGINPDHKIPMIIYSSLHKE